MVAGEKFKVAEEPTTPKPCRGHPLVQPTGPVIVGANGTYAFMVLLQAQRNGNDLNGRLYTITVAAQDNAGNPSSATATAVVPHDEGN